MTARGRPSDRRRYPDFTTPLTIPGGAMATAEVVKELPPEMVLPVWQTLRSVVIWAAEQPAMRTDLFEGCAMADWERQLLEDTWEDELRCPLAVLVGELANPTEDTPEALARACLAVTEWAIPRGYVGTGLAFAEVAALSSPQNSRYAWLSGGLLKQHGRLREAEQWLRRAAKAATSTANKDWEAQALAHRDLGIVLRDLGRMKQSVRYLNDALRTARKRKLRHVEGEILHELFVVTSLSGEHTEEHAEAALKLYGEGHPRLPTLAHDVASIWLLQGHHSDALAVLQHLPQLVEPDERVTIWGSLAWAAGAMGDPEAYRTAAEQVWALHDGATIQRSASAFLELAAGAREIGAWEEAERAAREAMAIAVRTGQSEVLTRAEERLNAIRHHAPRGGDAPTPSLQEAARPLGSQLVNSLLAMRT